jgi:hypothetical protein
MRRFLKTDPFQKTDPFHNVRPLFFSDQLLLPDFELKFEIDQSDQSKMILFTTLEKTDPFKFLGVNFQISSRNQIIPYLKFFKIHTKFNSMKYCIFLHKIYLEIISK